MQLEFQLANTLLACQNEKTIFLAIDGIGRSKSSRLLSLRLSNPNASSLEQARASPPREQSANLQTTTNGEQVLAQCASSELFAGFAGRNGESWKILSLLCSLIRQCKAAVTTGKHITLITNDNDVIGIKRADRNRQKCPF